jgi:hypothetical protein
MNHNMLSRQSCTDRRYRDRMVVVFTSTDDTLSP